MPVERPRLELDTKTTNSTSYIELFNLIISPDCKGLSSFTLAIDPDPNALYEVHTPILNKVDVEITAIWSVVFPHLEDGGIYKGFDAGDRLVLKHKTTDAAITVKTGYTLSMTEVLRK